jgi:ABC-type nitrate/sulfonate/bicarbonate transport system permease component
MRQRLMDPTLQVVGTLIVIALAWLYTESASGPSTYYILPLPTMLTDFKDAWFFEHFSNDLLPSLERIVFGFLAAVVIGVSAGLLLGSSRVLRLGAQPVLTFLRSIPAAALVPAAAIALGLGNTMRIGVIVFVCIWPVLLNTMDGVGELDRTVSETARAYRITGIERLRFVVLPAIGPRIATACRISLNLAVLTMIISESVAASSGIGYFLISSQSSFRIGDMWAAIIMLGLLGFILNAAFTVVERWRLRWYFRSQGATA